MDGSVEVPTHYRCGFGDFRYKSRLVCTRVHPLPHPFSHSSSHFRTLIFSLAVSPPRSRLIGLNSIQLKKQSKESMKSILSRKFSRSLSSLVSRPHQDNTLSLPDYYRDTRREIYGPCWSDSEETYYSVVIFPVFDLV